MTTPADATSVTTQVVVGAPIERAFSVFTDDFGSFKPPEHNLLGVDIAETQMGGELLNADDQRRADRAPC